MASARNTFQASEGGVRSVGSAATSTPKVEEPEEMEKQGAEDVDEGEVPVVEDLKIEDTPEPVPAAKGRVLFLYTCPSGSPIKYRMVYSSSVRGVQQDAVDKAGVQIAGKVCSGRPLVTGHHTHSRSVLLKKQKLS